MGPHFSDLKKVGELTFTISKLANEVFRITQQAARAKVQKWQGSGAVVKIGDISKSRKPPPIFVRHR